MPLHVRAGVNVVPLQLGATHTVPLAYSRQAPPPSQLPSAPQVAAPLSAHCPSGSAPAATSVHVPAVPVIPHERQLPVQAVRQQVPCSQKPLEHSAAAVHAAPLGRLPQLPPVQTLGATQFASVVQVFNAPVQSPAPAAMQSASSPASAFHPSASTRRRR